MTSRSPTVATPLPKSSTAPESPSKDASTTPQTVPFPSPETFEIIPPLHGILLRLLTEKGPSNGAGGASEGAAGAIEPTDTPTHSQPGSSNLPGGGNQEPTASQAVSDIPALGSNANQPLNVKDLPIVTSSVKIRIQKARAVVEGLPDVHRSVEDQQKEIAELEDRVGRLRSVIADFGERAGQA
ncbi:Mediator complex subunit Med9 [Penicillium chermesinum]|uniref:Mediator of RNA polymerase II transcription subunit 9 n=1 Tax=Penicillium chermesinum TaxID=63820 RepID=A0A9W9TSI8_9EURO|nr:Mediator complex subunit Med9 [Penicillium chermesinum]KAJ5239587.1 Mediator complex subunit Med9 [Penicillium chermesinum]KAJ6166479.1 Mediator complex subunit Med9 [Penicillium chermesinum]